MCLQLVDQQGKLQVGSSLSCSLKDTICLLSAAVVLTGCAHTNFLTCIWDVEGKE